MWRLGNFLVVFISAMLLVSGCSGIRGVEEYNEWLNNESNGCIISNSVAGYNISVKYQPASYLVLKQLKDVKKYSKNYIDSLIEVQSHMYTFLMTIGPDETEKKEDKKAGIMYEGIGNYSEYAERVMSVNFYIDQYIKLYIANKEKQPVFSLVENTYELSEHRSFLIVFDRGSKNVSNESGDCVFVYDDPYLGLGKMQFTFDIRKLNKADNLILAQE